METRFQVTRYERDIPVGSVAARIMARLSDERGNQATEQEARQRNAEAGGERLK